MISEREVLVERGAPVDSCRAVSGISWYKFFVLVIVQAGSNVTTIDCFARINRPDLFLVLNHVCRNVTTFARMNCSELFLLRKRACSNVTTIDSMARSVRFY